jgi:hypothetical protein
MGKNDAIVGDYLLDKAVKVILVAFTRGCVKTPS